MSVVCVRQAVCFSMWVFDTPVLNFGRNSSPDVSFGVGLVSSSFSAVGMAFLPECCTVFLQREAWVSFRVTRKTVCLDVSSFLPAQKLFAGASGDPHGVFDIS